MDNQTTEPKDTYHVWVIHPFNSHEFILKSMSEEEIDDIVAKSEKDMFGTTNADMGMTITNNGFIAYRFCEVIINNMVGKVELPREIHEGRIILYDFGNEKAKEHEDTTIFDMFKLDEKLFEGVGGCDDERTLLHASLIQRGQDISKRFNGGNMGSDFIDLGDEEYEEDEGTDEE